MTGIFAMRERDEARLEAEKMRNEEWGELPNRPLLSWEHKASEHFITQANRRIAGEKVRAALDASVTRKQMTRPVVFAEMDDFHGASFDVMDVDDGVSIHEERTLWETWKRDVYDGSFARTGQQEQYVSFPDWLEAKGVARPSSMEVYWEDDFQEKAAHEKALREGAASRGFL